MTQVNIYGHGPFIGSTGYSIHTREFFTALGDLFPVKIRNFTSGDTMLSIKQKSLLGSVSPAPDKNLFNIVIAESIGSKYLTDNYEETKILYNVWESTLQPTDFFNKALEFDQLWVPSEWQKECSINQGYPEDRVFVVPEGVNEKFKPPEEKIEKVDDVFRFLLVGKWEYRKATAEIIQCFLKTFNDDKIKLRILATNNFSNKSVVDNLIDLGIDPTDDRLEIIDFIDDDSYLTILQTSDVFVSCSRSEGWNLPLIEAMAVGLPSICSNCSGQMEFAKHGAILVDIVEERPASLNNITFPGNYYEPDFEHLCSIMEDVYENYSFYKKEALKTSDIIREKFSWEAAAIKAKNIIDNYDFSITNKIKNVDVITVATHETDGLKLLRKSCSLNNIKLNILGFNKKWTDFYMKAQELHSYLKTKDDDTIILFIDGYDSYFLTGINNIIHKFISMNCGILFSAEKNCSPDKSLINKYPEVTTPFRFLNAGGFIGYAGALKPMVDELIHLRSTEKNNNMYSDQYLWTRCYLDNKDKIKLDINCDIFQTLHSTSIDDFTLVGGGYKNNITGSFPCILHANGRSDDVFKSLLFKIYTTEILDVDLNTDNKQLKITFLYKGLPTVASCSIKDEDTGRVLYSSTMKLENNFNYFIQANQNSRDFNNISFSISNPNYKFTKQFKLPISNKRAFIITWFGAIPHWFDYFIKSCKHNKEFDFIIFTDQIMCNSTDNNIIFYRFSLNDFNNLIKIKLNKDFEIKNSYKLCDFKAMYGYLFEDYLTGYGYWGFCDIDLIWGNLGDFFNESLEQGVDIITLGADTEDLHYRIAGPCTLVKNNNYLTKSFMLVPEYEDVFKTQDYINFEEKSWDLWLKAQRNVELQIILNAQAWENGVVSDEAVWINGKLYLPSNREIAMYHFRTKDKLFIDTISGFKILPPAKNNIPDVIDNRDDLIFITGGDSEYMPLISVLAKSIEKFSKYKLVVYGYNCEVPFDNVIKRTIVIDNEDLTTNIKKSSYLVAKERCCIDVINQNYAKNYVWIDGDSFVSKSIDKISKYSTRLINYPLINSHIHDTIWDNRDITTPIERKLLDDLGVGTRKHYPWLHACLFIFNNECKGFFEEVLRIYNTSDKSYFKLLTDELVLNCLIEQKNLNDHMDVHDFDTYNAEHFNMFLDGNYIDAYKQFSNMLSDNLSRHAKLPSSEDDIYIFHGQKSFEGAEKLYKKYLKKIETKSNYFYVPHSNKLVDLKIDTSLLRYTYKEVFEHREYDYPNCTVQKDDVVVDCGANIGIFTRYASSKLAKQIISIEPAPSNYNCLVKNTADLDNCILFNRAVSNVLSTKTLFLDVNSGGHSFISYDINNTKTGKDVEVDCITIDTLFDTGVVEKIDFLKVDVEGAELEIFEGISDINLQKINKMAIEYHHAKFNFDEDVRSNFIDRLVKNGFEYSLVHLGSNNALQMIYVWKDVTIKICPDNIIINHHFINGPFCEVKGPSHLTGTYTVEFINSDTNKLVWVKKDLSINCWAKANIKWFIKWKIRVIDNTTGTVIREINFDPTGRRIYIALDSKSLGDTLAWFPYVDEFRKKWNCTVVVSTFWNDLLSPAYPELLFVKPGTVVENLYGMYTVGWYSFDENKNPANYRSLPLQQTASDILGLGEFKEVNVKLQIPHVAPPKYKYICIAIHSTAQCKYWNNPDGWSNLISWFNSIGYKVHFISKEENGYMGNFINGEFIDKSGNASIEDRIIDLYNAELFVGVGSGLSWLAHAVGTPVVLISGFSEVYTEFTPAVRIINKDVCHGCFNRYKLDASDWNWCPEHKNFECTRNITSDDVIQQILDSGLVKILQLRES